MTHVRDAVMCVAGAIAFLIAGDLDRVLDNGAAFPKGAEAEVLSAAGTGSEGPAWDPEWGLLSTGKGNINRRTLDGRETVFREDAGANGLLFDREGRLLACEPKRRRVTRTSRDGAVEVLTDSYDGQPYNQPNDLALDSKGRIYFSDACYGGPQNIRQRSADGRSIEGVYRIDAPGKVQRVLGNDDVERANGVLVSADDRFLFVADNCNDRHGGSRKLLRFALRDDGTIEPGARKVLYEWGESRGPDGIKQDAEGRLYVAGGNTKPQLPFEPDTSRPGGIYVFDSMAGTLLQFLGAYRRGDQLLLRRGRRPRSLHHRRRHALPHPHEHSRPPLVAAEACTILGATSYPGVDFQPPSIRGGCVGALRARHRRPVAHRHPPRHGALRRGDRGGVCVRTGRVDGRRRPRRTVHDPQGRPDQDRVLRRRRDPRVPVTPPRGRRTPADVPLNVHGSIL
jgi:gluconolactonase